MKVVCIKKVWSLVCYVVQMLSSMVVAVLCRWLLGTVMQRLAALIDLRFRSLVIMNRLRAVVQVAAVNWRCNARVVHLLGSRWSTRLLTQDLLIRLLNWLGNRQFCVLTTT